MNLGSSVEGRVNIEHLRCDMRQRQVGYHAVFVIEIDQSQNSSCRPAKIIVTNHDRFRRTSCPTGVDQCATHFRLLCFDTLFNFGVVDSISESEEVLP